MAYTVMRTNRKSSAYQQNMGKIQNIMDICWILEVKELKN